MQQKLITRSPIDNGIYIEREFATSEQITDTIANAHRAQKKWQTVVMEERAAICHAMVDAMLANKEQIAEQLCWMMGRPIRYAAKEVDGFAERARYMIDIAQTSLEVISLPKQENCTRYIKREPLGLVFVIAPWNYPYLTAVNAIVPAIMAGNSVLLKHSVQTPLCAEQLFHAFQVANLPEGVFQYLHLTHVDTQLIIHQHDINYVAFTGSVTGGEMVERGVSGRFINVGLELGGKDAAYVRADADISSAVATCIDGAFFNSGQSCCGIERIYVDDSIYDEFVKQAVELINGYQLGRPDQQETTLGPVVSAAAADIIREQIADAISHGAKAHINVDNFPLDNSNNAYLAPQLLTDVDHAMAIMTEESFGPVVAVMRAFNDKQAISLINDSQFGLTASVFSRDIARAAEIGEQLEVGTFFVNRCDYLDPALAWTGYKNSGKGCTLSRLGYELLTKPKSYFLQKSP